jgi:hypothetical protein
MSEESRALILALQRAHKAMGDAALALNEFRALCDDPPELEAPLFDAMWDAQREASAIQNALDQYRLAR